MQVTPVVFAAVMAFLVSYKYMYEFRLLCQDGSKRVDFKFEYHGVYYAPGILFLSVLSLQPRITESDLLRPDLIPWLGQVERLRTKREAEHEQPDSTNWRTVHNQASGVSPRVAMGAHFRAARFSLHVAAFSSACPVLGGSFAFSRLNALAAIS